MAKTSKDPAGKIVLQWVDPPPQMPAIDHREQEALYYFRDLVLDSSSSTWDTDMWRRLVMPMSVNQPVVRHAVVALGALSRSGKDRSAYGVRRYGLAMQSLQNEIAHEGRAAHHLALVACILFVAIEFVQEGWRQAHFHLNGGLSIVKEIQEQPPTRQSIPSKSDIAALEELFGRMDNQMSLFTSSRVQLRRAEGNGCVSVLPADVHFKTIEDAIKIQSLQIAAMRELVCAIDSKRFESPENSPADRVEYEIQQGRQLASLGRWHTAFQRFIPELKDAQHARLAKQLLMSHLCCRMMVSNALSDGREVVYDRFQSEFEQIVTLAAELLPSSPTQKQFSLDTGAVAPIYYAVLKCRDPALRRRAITLLASFNVQEGAWDSTRLATLAKKVVWVEEQGVDSPRTAADVPEHNRLWRAYFDLTIGDHELFCMRRAWESEGKWLQYQVYVG